MVLISIVAVWLALALILGVTLGRSIRRADVVELKARTSWDAGRGADRSAVTDSPSVAAESVSRPVAAARAA
jgi:hypothetical protein